VLTLLPRRIIGEESYSAGQEKRFLLDDEPTWIIDPLDGVRRLSLPRAFLD